MQVRQPWGFEFQVNNSWIEAKAVYHSADSVRGPHDTRSLKGARAPTRHPGAVFTALSVVCRAGAPCGAGVGAVASDGACHGALRVEDRPLHVRELLSLQPSRALAVAAVHCGCAVAALCVPVGVRGARCVDKRCSVPATPCELSCTHRATLSIALAVSRGAERGLGNTNHGVVG